jgi:penicillin amidase/acyl-homoserine-lactone acylase
MKIAIIGAGALAAIAAAAGLYLATPSRAFDAKAARAAAAAYDVRIIRDRFGVPHIYGARDADVAFGLAYAHAEDDWKSIEEVLFFSRGELGRIKGREGAVSDYLVAALGVWRDIAAKYETDLAPETRAVAEAYAAGINLWCAEKRGRCAPGAAPVSGEDIVAGFVARTPFFYGLDDDLKALFRDAPKKAAEIAAIRTALLRISPGVEIGSNAVAVAPSRSADGHTRLLVNSHQPYTGPVAWYEARLKSGEGLDIIGGVFPGSPVILHGAGPALGWAHTVNSPDLVDVYALAVDDPKRPTKYRFDGGWRDLERARAQFRVKLFGPFSLPVSRPVYRSVHGPAFTTPTGVYAVAYGGQGDIRSLEQWRRMGKAQDFAGWRAAMEMQAIPSLNAVYADRTGTIAYFYNAAIPVRAEGQDWSQTADGARADLLWSGVRPFGSAPFIVDPKSGYVANANNNPFEASDPEDSPKAEDYPPSYGVDMRTTNRGLRLLELYGADAAISADEFVAYKMDHFYSEDSRLAKLVAGLVADENLAGDPEARDAVALLKSWDRSAATDSRAAALAIRTGRLALGWYLAGSDAETPSPAAALAQAAQELEAAFGRIDPEWGEAMRLERGDLSLPINGAIETLRAVYPDDARKRGPWIAAGGDTLIITAEWPAAGGGPQIRTIHQFGSATLDEASPHYADQAAMFAAEDWKTPPLTLDGVLAEATADYRPGRRSD